MSGPPVLVVCAHGTANPDGQRVVREAAEQVGQALPGVEVHDAYVDVQGPELVDVLAGIGAARPTVLVPFLLAAGYHAYVDIPKAVKGRASTVVTPALGPDERLTDIVIERLEQAGVARGTPVVLASAGSSDPRSQRDTQAAALMLERRWVGPVSIGHAADVEPTVGQALEAARAAAQASGLREPVIASYLLAPGYFQGKLEAAGAAVCTAPLAPDARLVQIVVDRYREAVPPEA